MNIRTKAVCIFRQNGKILLAEGYDPVKDEKYLIPVGGGVEFGEQSYDAIRREVMEEIRSDIKNIELLGVKENIFSFNGKACHEITFVYEAKLCDEGIYQRDEITGVESNGNHFLVRWHDENVIDDAHIPIYPEGIRELLKH